jgi:hypothetical protein
MFLMSRDSSVVIARAEWPAFDSRQEKGICLYSNISAATVEPIEPPIQ